MLHDPKDVLALIASVSASLLSPIVTVLALFPILSQVVSGKMANYFAAEKQYNSLIFALKLLTFVSAALLFNLGLVCVAVLVTQLQESVAIVSTVTLILSVAGFLAAIGMGARVLIKATAKK